MSSFATGFATVFFFPHENAFGLEWPFVTGVGPLRRPVNLIPTPICFLTCPFIRLTCPFIRPLFRMGGRLAPFVCLAGLLYCPFEAGGLVGWGVVASLPTAPWVVC